MVESEAGRAPDRIQIPRYSASYELAGGCAVSAYVFASEGNRALLHEAVRMQLANRRAGTAATKTRGAVSGGGAKPWRQKGTGRARAGSIRSPLWRHGAIIFGPQPRDYSYQMPKRAWRKALRLALSERAREGRLKVVEELKLPEAKTRFALEALNRLGMKAGLVVVDESETDFVRAARNLAKFKILDCRGLNVYDILGYPEVLMTEKALRAVEARLGSDAHD